MNQNQFKFPEQFSGFSFTEYLTIFIGLVFALAVAEFFLSVGQLIREGKRVRFYWEYYLWILVLLDLFTLTWYVSWVRLEFITDGLFMFSMFTFPNLVIFLITSVYFPSFRQEGEVDLKVHFHSIRPKFFWLFSIYALMNIILDLSLGLLQSNQLAIIAMSIFMVLGILNAVYSQLWLRLTLAFFFLIEFVAMMFVL